MLFSLNPGYPPFSVLPESLGIETRFYTIRKENGFRFDLDEIKRLADRNTKLILINSPAQSHRRHHHRCGTRRPARVHASREIQLISDEVYHPIYHGRATKSASRLPHATVIHDFSKAFPLPECALDG